MRRITHAYGAVCNFPVVRSVLALLCTIKGHMCRAEQPVICPKHLVICPKQGTSDVCGEMLKKSHLKNPSDLIACALQLSHLGFFGEEGEVA